MRLFISIVDGQPFGHPIAEDNFVQVFPNIDCNNLPNNFALFQRVEQPSLEKFEILEGCTYQWVDGVVKDVWKIRKMTPPEQEVFIENLKNQVVPKGWVFDTETNEWVKPKNNDLLNNSGSSPNVIG